MGGVGPDDSEPVDLYAVLNVNKAASETEVRRAYRNLISKSHPDKGGDPETFKLIHSAYEILSDKEKRGQYDRTGTIIRSVEEEFMDSFGGGNFRDRVRQTEATKASIEEQITVHQSKEAGSHTAGFEAWMRARGKAGAQVFGSEQVIEQFGVVKGSYDAVQLPKIKAYTITCKKGGKPRDVLSVDTVALPAELDWGEVLVRMRCAPINPADLYSVVTGGTYGDEAVSAPFTAGHDGVGVVIKVGPGVKSLVENDWVLPLRPHMGTWRSLAVWKEKDALRIPADALPIESAALVREMFTAYRLLEDHGNLKPGDCVIFNAASSTVGQLLTQLCALLHLRAVAVVSAEADYDKTAAWLKGLGAGEVLLDQGSFKVELDKLKFFAKPKLALDTVGGASALRLTEALAEGGQLVVYGCMSGKSPSWPWRAWVFQGLQVKGFNVRRWMKDNKKKIPAMLASIAKLVAAGKLRMETTEYDLATEFEEALEHASDRGKNTKIILQSSDIGVEY